METIKKYFPNLTDKQIQLFEQLGPLYQEWNEKVNLISRKDVDHFYERHVLHSLAIAKVFEFEPFSHVMDLGCGGGFPGIPLAILFPNTKFLMVDSIGKKINVVNDVIEKLGLTNAKAVWSRAEDVDQQFDVVVTRAVTQLEKLFGWTRKKTKHIIALKGGDLTYEISAVASIKKKLTIHPIKDIFEGEFFETKVVLDIKLS
ncbi:MAG: 16S rRNA (guanine(527)-N(7))-methyltransferase RsmG [Chitinophagales bacterium]